MTNAVIAGLSTLAIQTFQIGITTANALLAIASIMVSTDVVIVAAIVVVTIAVAATTKIGDFK